MDEGSRLSAIFFKGRLQSLHPWQVDTFLKERTYSIVILVHTFLAQARGWRGEYRTLGALNL
jgi:hypothetical protein